MKRSEIIDHIKEELLDKLNHRFFNQNIDLWSAHVANEMLDMIEGFGVLPPLRDKMVDGKFVGYSNMQVPEWDEE